MTVSRRTIATGAAWAVPVIVTGAAAPKVAASSPVVIVQATGGGCKFPGRSNKNYPYGYKLLFKVTGASVGSLVNAVSCITPAGVANVFFENQSTVVGSDFTFEIIIGSSNSANGTATLTFVVGGVTIPVTVNFGDGFNPCK